MEGKPVSGRTKHFGWKIVGNKVEPETSERAVIEDMLAKKRYGRSIRLITEDLNKAGIESVTGSPWHYSSVKDIVRKELH